MEKPTKYKVGDRFIVDITEVNTSGMGVVYYLGNQLTASERQLDFLEVFEQSPLLKEKEAEKPKNDTHTLEELRERIMRLNIVLGECVKKYKDLKAQTSEVCQILDAEIEE